MTTKLVTLFSFLLLLLPLLGGGSVSANASSIAELSPTPSSNITTAAITTEPTIAESTATTIQIAPNTTETAPIAPTIITTEPGIDLDNGDGENGDENGNDNGDGDGDGDENEERGNEESGNEESGNEENGDGGGNGEPSA